MQTPDAPSPSPTPPAGDEPPDAKEPTATLRDRVIDTLRTVYDPEIPVNIYELGLIYDVVVDEEAPRVHVLMTLTSPACPVAGSLPGEVETRVRQATGVQDVIVELVWDPPWDPSKLSEAARLQLGLM
jgi:FeS assembly SUF system protein